MSKNLMNIRNTSEATKKHFYALKSPERNGNFYMYPKKHQQLLPKYLTHSKVGGLQHFNR